MTDYTMNNDDRKLLTEFLGECWHEWTEGSYRKGKNGYGCLCNKCEVVMYSMHQDSYMTDNRTFDNPDDQHKVFKKLVEEDKWVGFFWKNLVMGSVPEDIAYLFINPERFNKLVADYLKEEVK